MTARFPLTLYSPSTLRPEDDHAEGDVQKRGDVKSNEKRSNNRKVKDNRTLQHRTQSSILTPTVEIIT